jgi:hypothetical protein
MFHLSKFKYALAILTCSVMPLTAYSNIDKISDWPSPDGINLEPAKKHFIEVFANLPDNLDHLYQGFKDCNLNQVKLGKLSGVNKETLMSFYQSSSNNKTDLKLEIHELRVLSTLKGCADLHKEKLERVPDTKFKMYQVTAKFKHSYLIYADYSSKTTSVFTVGSGEHKSEHQVKIVSNRLNTVPKDPIISIYPRQTYQRLDMSMSGSPVTKHYFLVMQSMTPPTKEGAISMALVRSGKANELKNNLNIEEKRKGLKHSAVIGNHTKFTMIDEKPHGLVVTENYQYATDKTQNKYTTTCYEMSENLNVFKILPNNTCIKVDDDQIGMTDVHVSALYQIQLDAKRQAHERKAGSEKRMAEHKRRADERAAELARRMAEIKTKSRQSSGNSKDKVGYASVVQEQKRQREAVAKSEKARQFITTQQHASCRLNNQNWAYTGIHCKDGLAEGEGSSVDREGLRFVGSFKAGERVKGEIQQNGEMIFSGELKNDKPEGSALCLWEGEYEECRFFRGKRIDNLYKQRKENAKHLAKMEEIQKKNALANSQANSTNNKQSNMVADAIEKEATKRVTSFIFDQLF